MNRRPIGRNWWRWCSSPFTLLRAPEFQRRYLREARLAGFRQVIVEASQQTCALCRLRLVTPEGHRRWKQHISPRGATVTMMIRESGLALCRLHHWTFDQGLVGIRPDAVVEVSALVEQGENQADAVLALQMKTLSLPPDPALAPAKAALEWHWQQVLAVLNRFDTPRSLRRRMLPAPSGLAHPHALAGARGPLSSSVRPC